jgi:hypothetical protein
MLPESDPKDLAIRALARSATISDLSARHGVSRKFVYQQARKAGAALDDVFLSSAPETVLHGGGGRKYAGAIFPASSII